MLCDEDRYGFTLSYSMGEGAGGGKAYVQYGQRESDDAFASKRDVDYWTVGYSYFVTEAVHVRLVHQMKDAYEKDDAMRLTSNTSAVVLKVDF